MPRPDPNRVLRLDAAFVRFNSERSLSDVEPRLEERAFGSAVAFRDAARADDVYYNQVLGLGESNLPALDAMVAWYHEAGLSCAVWGTPDRAGESVLAALAERGFVGEDKDTYFARRPARDATPSPGTIRRATRADLHHLLALWTIDDPSPPDPSLIERKGDAQLRDDFPVYLLELGGAPVAMASTFVHDGLAFLGNAVTRPEYRGRGCHAALLRHRVADAAAMGLRWAITDARWGTVSQRNILRAGFERVWQPTQWVLPPR